MLDEEQDKLNAVIERHEVEKLATYPFVPKADHGVEPNGPDKRHPR
jgi:hypothetical protein